MPPIISKLVSWVTAREAGDRISAEIRAIRREFVGKMAIERLPFGTLQECKILEIDWEQSYGLNGGWAVFVEYVGGELDGMQSWTTDTVLFFQGSK